MKEQTTQKAVRRNTSCIGVIPCAGKQVRMKELRFSKELLPLFDGRPVIQHSIDALKLVTSNIIAVTNPNKKDLMRYLEKKKIDIIIEKKPVGLPTSIAQVRIKQGVILFALPDTYFEPIDVFKRLAGHRRENVVGLFDSGKPELFDSVKMKKDGKITKYAVKINPPLSKWTMGCGKLSPTAMQLLRRKPVNNQEVLFGDTIQPLVRKGELYGITLPDSKYQDLGTPERYIEFLLTSH